MTAQRLGLDTNVLVHLHVPSSASHERVRATMQRLIHAEGAVLVLTPTVMDEFVHLITDPKRFSPAVTMSEALGLARLYLGHQNVEWAAASEQAFAHAIAVMDRLGLGRKRISDCLIAATYLQHGVDALITCDPEDFRGFEQLRIIDPR